MSPEKSAMLALGNFIRERREARGWSQTDLAGRMGSPKMKSSVSRWEAGEVDEIELSSLIDLADALEVSRWRMIEQLYPLEIPQDAQTELHQDVARLIDAFPWLNGFLKDLVALTEDDRRGLLTYLEVLKQKTPPARTPQRARDRG